MPYCSLKGQGVITTNRGRKETTMANKRLWQEIVDDYYREANYYLGVKGV